MDITTTLFKSFIRKTTFNKLSRRPSNFTDDGLTRFVANRTCVRKFKVNKIKCRLGILPLKKLAQRILKFKIVEIQLKVY